MNLTPEQMDLGRRNFLKVIAGTPAVVALGAAAATRGPVPGGRVRIAFIGVSHWHAPLFYRPAVRLAGVQIVGVSDDDPAVAEAARAAFGAWHAYSLLVNLATVALVTVAMGLAACLPGEARPDATRLKGEEGADVNAQPAAAS